MARFLLRRPRMLLVDVDTQYDLLLRNSADDGDILRRIRRLFAWARRQSVPIISTTVTHRPDEHSGTNGINCIEGTLGQKKIPYTLLKRHTIFPAENRLDLPRDLFQQYRQVIFEKRTEDPFTNPRADRLFSEVKVDEFVVMGSGLETAIKATVLGLIYRMKKVILVTDAIDCGTDERTTELALRQIEAKGAYLTTTEELAGKSSLVGVPHLQTAAMSHASSG